MKKMRISEADKQLISDLLKQGVKYTDIVKRVGVSAATVQNIKSRLRSVGELQYDWKSEEESQDFSIDDPAGVNEKVLDSTVREQIKQLWCGNEVTSRDICKEIGISLKKFNRVIERYKISKFTKVC